MNFVGREITDGEFQQCRIVVLRTLLSAVLRWIAFVGLSAVRRDFNVVHSSVEGNFDRKLIIALGLSILNGCA